MQNESRTTERAETDWRKQVISMIIVFLGNFMPNTLAVRLVSLVLICGGFDNRRISELTKYCPRSISSLRASIKKVDFAGLLQISGGGRKMVLADVEDDLIRCLEEENYHTLQQIVDMIREKYGISTSKSAVKCFLSRHGFKKLKSGSLPAKADKKAQRAFYEDILSPLMEKAEEAAGVVLLYMDAAHFVTGSDFLGSVWCRMRRYARTLSGRNRYNVLGVIDHRTKAVLTVTNDTYITAAEVQEMLYKVRETYPAEEVHIVLDNARYQKCEAVTTLAAGLGIYLEYVPPYSPNLNMIERFWKFVKTRLRRNYFTDFSVFKATIDDIIRTAATSPDSEIHSLIGKKVQLFDTMAQINSNTLEAVRTA